MSEGLVLDRYRTDYSQLNNFLVHQTLASFLQSGEWASFQAALDKTVYAQGLGFQDDQLVSLILTKETSKHFFHYLYCPRGPVLVSGLSPKDRENIWLEILCSLIKMRHKRPLVFIRLEPYEPSLSPNGYLWINNPGFKRLRLKEVSPHQPSVTRIIDLTRSVTELEAGLHPKTRYSLHLAERKGVEISQPIVSQERDLAHFLRLLHETTKRDGFRSHTDSYYQIFLKTLAIKDVATLGSPEKCYSRLFLAWWQGQVVAASIVVFFGDMAVYLYGASHYASRQAMAPCLLHWQTMLEAKRLGYKFYDLWGVKPENPQSVSALAWQKTQSWAGISRFKAGFGGQVYYYPGTFDLILRPNLYRVYNSLKAFSVKLF